MTLEELCKKFITDNKISTPETIYQCDWVEDNVFDFVESICDMLGYYEGDEEE